MGVTKTRFTRGLILTADDIGVEGVEGELKVAATAKKLQVYLDGALRNVVTEAQVQPLSNKTIDADLNTIPNLEVDNLKAGVLNTDLSAGPATDLQIPSALAVQTVVDSAQGEIDDLVSLSGMPVNSTDLGTFTGTTIPDSSTVKNALQALETGLEDHMADPSDAHDASAISAVPTVTTPSTNVQGVIEDINDEFAHSGSTGILYGGVLSINADPAKFDLAAGSGWVVNSSDYSAPTRTKVTWSAFSAQTVTNLLSQDVTYISINSAGAIVQQATFPTPQEKRTNIFIGRLNHQNNVSISFADTFPDTLQSEQSQYFDLVDAIGPFNYNGNIVAPNGANLSINKSAGKLFNASFNYASNNQSPNNVITGALTAPSFLYQTQSSNGSTTTLVDPANYDVGGVITAIPGASTVATVQRVYLFPSNNIRIQYGQEVYANLADALASFDTENFVENTTNTNVAVLIGFIAVTKGATDLSNSTQAKIIIAPKFGGATGSASGATTNLQQAYDNSVTPEILTNSLLGAFTVKRGSASDTDNVMEVQNGAGTNTATIKGDGSIAGTKLDIDNVNIDGSTVSSATLVLDGSSSTTIEGSTSSIALGTNIVKSTVMESLSGAVSYTPSSLAASGSNVTISPGNVKVLQLTNPALVSINAITSAASGQEIILINKSGVDVTVNNNSGANGILTGTGNPITFKTDTALYFSYDGTASRWFIVGGTGGGAVEVTGTAGENLNANDLVYISTGTGNDSGRTAGRMYKVDASNDDRIEAVGFIAATVLAGASCVAKAGGVLDSMSGLTAGVMYFASTTPGAITATAPSTNGQWSIPVGIATASNRFLVNPVPSSAAVYIQDSSFSFTIDNNQASATDVTGLLIDPATYRAFFVDYTIYRSTSTTALAQVGQLRGVYNTFSSTWFMSDDFSGENSGVTFTITTGGQIKYTSTNVSGSSYSGTLKHNLRKTFGI